MRYILFLIMVATPFLQAQKSKINDVQQTTENGCIIIAYTLSGKNDDTYNITLTAQNEKGETITPHAITGDLKDVTPGQGKSIRWEPQLEGIPVTGWKVNLAAIKNFIQFIFVQGGTFQMGSTIGRDNEKPVHTVTVLDFSIGKYEVTQKQWVEIMGSNPSNNKGNSLPVEQVSWYDVQAFIRKLNKREGRRAYRLPTEAEWEYAARGGNKSKGYTYSGSNTIGDVVWYDKNSGNTHEVGTKLPNELGIYDMSGNVWEWCSDRYDENYYNNSPVNNPQGPSSGNYRVLRGGSWFNLDDACRVSYRVKNNTIYLGQVIGFRLVRQ